MALWKKTLAGCEVKINDVDHPPPHCHVRRDRGGFKVNLMTLTVMDPPPHELPANLRKALLDPQEELLEAWEMVRVIPSGQQPGRLVGG
jgi:hypothetical protein